MAKPRLPTKPRPPRQLLPRLLLCALAGAWFAGSAHAQQTNVELLGMLGGRIIGGAKGCGVNRERIRSAGEKVRLLVLARANSEAERRNALRYFEAAQPVGEEETRADKDRCPGVHVELSEIEVKLAKFPGPESDATMAGRFARPVPPLGELRPGLAGATAKP